MSVYGVGSPSGNHPATNPTSGAPAFSFVALSQLSEISGSMAAKGASGTSGVSSASGPTAVLYAEMQALADLAKIHLYLSQNDTTDALAAANDFMSLKAQCNLSDPNISALYAQATNYFTTNSSGQVTGFQNDSGGNSFGTWWSQGTASNSSLPGAQYEFDWLESLSKQSPRLYPSVPPQSNTPAVFVDLCLMYADAMTVPSVVKNNIDQGFWGNNTGGTEFSFAQIFPYAMAAYAYQMTFIDPSGDKSWSTFGKMMQQMQTLMNAASQLSNAQGNYPNFYASTQELSYITSAYQGNNANDDQWPPPRAPGITDTEWAILQGTLYPNGKTPTDLSNFYGLTDVIFGSYEYNT